jgi:hypothetical protein
MLFLKDQNRNINDKIKRSKELLILLFGSLIINVDINVAECGGRAGKEAGKSAWSVSNRHSTITEKPPIINTSKRKLIYEVKNAAPETSSHEQCEVNPVLGSSPKKAFQHPQVSRKHCDQANCENQVCDAPPCGQVTKEDFIAHGTHDAGFPSAVFISHTDLSGDEKRPQYGVFYDTGVPSHSSTGQTNPELTKNLNQNHEARDNVHMNAPKNKNKVEEYKNDIKNPKDSDDNIN